MRIVDLQVVDEDLLRNVEVVDEICGDPTITLALGAWPLGDGEWRVEIQIRRESPHDDLVLACLEWIDSRLARLYEHGPQPDGWGLRPDLGYQLVGRLLTLPPLDA